MWRCVSRLDYGTKYCHHSPTLDEEPLQRAVLAAINEAMGSRNEMVRQITETMELELAALPGQTVSLSDIQRQIGELEGRFNLLLEQAAEQLGEPSYVEQFQAITNEIAALKMQRGQMEEQRKSNVSCRFWPRRSGGIVFRTRRRSAARRGHICWRRMHGLWERSFWRGFFRRCAAPFQPALYHRAGGQRCPCDSSESDIEEAGRCCG